MTGWNMVILANASGRQDAHGTWGSANAWSIYVQFLREDGGTGISRMCSVSHFDTRADALVDLKRVLK